MKVRILICLFSLVLVSLLVGADWPPSPHVPKNYAVMLEGATLRLRVASERAKQIPNLYFGDVEIVVRARGGTVRFTGVVLSDRRVKDCGQGRDQITLEVW